MKCTICGEEGRVEIYCEVCGSFICGNCDDNNNGRCHDCGTLLAHFYGKPLPTEQY